MGWLTERLADFIESRPHNERYYLWPMYAMIFVTGVWPSRLALLFLPFAFVLGMMSQIHRREHHHPRR